MLVRELRSLGNQVVYILCVCKCRILGEGKSLLSRRGSGKIMKDWWLVERDAQQVASCIEREVGKNNKPNRNGVWRWWCRGEPAGYLIGWSSLIYLPFPSVCTACFRNLELAYILLFNDWMNERSSKNELQATEAVGKKAPLTVSDSTM